MRGMLMSLTTMSTVPPIAEHIERLGAVAGEQKPDFAVPDLPAKLLLDEGLQVRLVVDDAGSSRS